METTRADRATGADLDRAAPRLRPAVVTGVLLGIGIAGTHGADELVTAHRARIRRMIGSHRVRRIQTRVVALEDEMCGGIQQKGA